MVRERRIRSALVALSIPALLVGALAWWTYARARQRILNHTLLAAVAKDDTSSALRRLAEGADASARYEAVEGPATLKERILRWLDRRRPSAGDETPALVLAVEMHNTDVVRALLARGADVNARGKEEGRAALIAACLDRQTEIVQLLLDHGADVTPKDNGLVMLGAVEIGADGVQRASRTPGQTALQYATEYPDQEIIRLLKQYGAKE